MPVSPALREMVRKIDAGTLDYVDAPLPIPDLPPVLGVIFGSQLGWSRDREAPRALACLIDRDRETGLPVVVQVCPACGGNTPGSAIHRGSALYCAACCGSGYDHLVPTLLCKYPPPPLDRVAMSAPEAPMVDPDTGETVKVVPPVDVNRITLPAGWAPKEWAGKIA